MSMFDLALRSGLPVIQVHTEELQYLEKVLSFYSHGKVMPLKAAPTAQTLASLVSVFYTMDPAIVTSDLPEKLAKANKHLVLVNCESPLAFNAGPLDTPPQMVEQYLESLHLSSQHLLPVCKGLTLKEVAELVALTTTHYDGVKSTWLRQMRMMMGKPMQGLTPQDTALPFYDPMEDLEAWLAVNKPYFLKEGVNPDLVPRGLMFDGAPGTGKSLASKRIANVLGVPLYRLDIATTLNRYIGESEAKLASYLSHVEKEAPCVVLFDEVEKLFTQGGNDAGVIERMLSQLLWWLQAHRSKVLSVMTTNDVSKIPPELYRPGRVDRVFHVQLMSHSQAQAFALRYLTSLLGKDATPAQAKAVKVPESQASPAAVVEYVKNLVKEKKWL